MMMQTSKVKESYSKAGWGPTLYKIHLLDDGKVYHSSPSPSLILDKQTIQCPYLLFCISTSRPSTHMNVLTKTCIHSCVSVCVSSPCSSLVPQQHSHSFSFFVEYNKLPSQLTEKNKNPRHWDHPPVARYGRHRTLGMGCTAT